jgi:ribosome-associated protein
MPRIYITPTLTIDESELEERFAYNSGPGGQNVNKVETAVQLRFDAERSPSLSPDLRARLSRLAGRRITKEGVLVIDARRFRTQERNREDALERLKALLARAASAPKPRKKTRPSRAAREERLQIKARRGELKKTREKPRIE